MAKPTFVRSLSEVTQCPSIIKTLKSQKTGKEYQTEVIERLNALSTGVVEVVNGGWKYSVVLKPHNLELSIKVSEFLEVEMGEKATLFCTKFIKCFYALTRFAMGVW